MIEPEYILFPYEISESEVLYITGNGFDIAHGIKSKYSDFKTWCRKNNKNIGIFDSLFSTRKDFWCDIESALGDYDEKEILDFCKPDEEFDLDHSLSSSARIEDAPMSILEPALCDLRNFFVEWVNSIDISYVRPFIKLHKNAKYLTFNYTETLESIYSIPSKNVCHIHGCRLSKDDNYIFGHDNNRDINSYGNNLLFFEENVYLSILEYLNAFQKPINEIISGNSHFFDELRDTKLVFVLGHSLSQIDTSYFKHLLSQFEKQPKFIFSAYDKNDINNIGLFVRENDIKIFEIINLDDLEIV